MDDIKIIFLDIGGVLLTNGWDHDARKRAAKHFDLDLSDLNSRHQETFDTYEIGKISLQDYLERIIFYKKRLFTQKQFTTFMFRQSKPYSKMIELMCRLKKKYRLKIAVVSNEGRELNEYRIQKFKLDRFVDFFISSSFVHLRKPDQDIYRLALDVAQVPSSQVLYIEDRPLFIQVAKQLGMRGICHVDYESTLRELSHYGFKV